MDAQSLITRTLWIYGCIVDLLDDMLHISATAKRPKVTFVLAGGLTEG